MSQSENYPLERLPVLQIEGLTKRFGRLEAVKNLSLDVYPGEILGLLGPNGAGKTTSIHLICGLLQPDSGRVVIHGRPVHNGSVEMRSKIGVCPQQNLLWERLTCLEQLEFLGKLYGMRGASAKKRGIMLLEEMGLGDKRSQQARFLSGGMQRRLNLIMALIHDPELVILDEPEAGLDPQSRIMVRDYIRSFARIKTVILTTHNMDEAERVADRVAVIDHGELLVVDTPAALKSRLGGGDVIDILLVSPVTGESALRHLLMPISTELTISADRLNLQIRALNAVRHLPEVFEALEASGCPAQEMSLRANTLEDVFIQLTGRRLRE